MHSPKGESIAKQRANTYFGYPGSCLNLLFAKHVSTLATSIKLSEIWKLLERAAALCFKDAFFFGIMGLLEGSLQSTEIVFAFLIRKYQWKGRKVIEGKRGKHHGIGQRHQKRVD